MTVSSEGFIIIGKVTVTFSILFFPCVFKRELSKEWNVLSYIITITSTARGSFCSYEEQKVLNVLPIILFSEIAQQLRTKEGRRKILLFFTIVVEKQQTKASLSTSSSATLLECQTR